MLTFLDAISRYSSEVLPLKAPATQRSNNYSIHRLTSFFNDYNIEQITTDAVYKYRYHTSFTYSRKIYNLDHEVLSHLFTKLQHWGFAYTDPIKPRKVTKFSLSHRSVMPADIDITRFYDSLPRKWQLYITLKIWTGRRKAELLRLKYSDLLDAGIRFTNNKPPYDTFILAWEPVTRSVLHELSTLSQPLGSPYIFCTRNGAPYIKSDGSTSGFNSIWQRRMRAALDAGIVETRFTEHDLRKYRASRLSEDKAQLLLRHTTKKQTKVYRLCTEVIDLK